MGTFACRNQSNIHDIDTLQSFGEGIEVGKVAILMYREVIVFAGLSEKSRGRSDDCAHFVALGQRLLGQMGQGSRGAVHDGDGLLIRHCGGIMERIQCVEASR